MEMTQIDKLLPSDIRRFNLKSWLENHTVPQKEKSYFSQLASGTASFGEKAARRLEVQYNMGVGFLDTPAPVKDSGKKKDHLNELLKGDPGVGMEAGLLKCFRGCKEEDRELLLLMANKLYERARPDDGTANPKNRKNKTGITYLGDVEPNPENNDARNNKDNRVQKQGAG